MIYSNEDKQSIIDDYLLKGNATMIAKENNIAKSTLYRWMEDFKIRTPLDLKISKTVLRKKLNKLERLQKTNELYNKLLSLISLSTKQKLIYAKVLESEYSVHSLCKILNLSRGTYYNDKFRKVEITLIETDDNKYKPIINRKFTETKGRLGSPKIRRLMMNEGYKIDEKRVKRLMNELELFPNRPDDNYKNYHKRISSQKPSIISKKEYYSEPNMIWVSDITYIKYNKKHYYLFVILDLYSRKIIGYSLADSLEAYVLVDLMKDTYESRKKPENLIFHSDQGLQYTANSFRNYLKDNKIKQSFSKKGCPYDNAVVESFF